MALVTQLVYLKVRYMVYFKV